MVTKGGDDKVLRNALKWLRECCGGSRSTKHGVLPCKVAAADDEGQLVCAAGVVSSGLSLVFCNA